MHFLSASVSPSVCLWQLGWNSSHQTKEPGSSWRCGWTDGLQKSPEGLVHLRSLGTTSLSSRSPMRLKMGPFKFPDAAAGGGAGPGTTLRRPRTAITLSLERGGPDWSLALASLRCSPWSNWTELRLVSGLQSRCSRGVVCGLNPLLRLVCLFLSSRSSLLSN